MQAYILDASNRMCSLCTNHQTASRIIIIETLKTISGLVLGNGWWLLT